MALLVAGLLVLSPAAAAGPATDTGDADDTGATNEGRRSGIPPAATTTRSPGGATPPQLLVSQRTLDHAAPELVAAIVRGRERGTIEIHRDGDGLLLPLERLADLLSIEVRQKSLDTEVETPLGTRTVPGTALRAIDDRLHVRAAWVEGELLSDVRFDERRYAIELTPHWRASATTRHHAGDATPDFEPPSSTLAAVRAQVSHVEAENTGATAGSLQLGGRLAEGIWTVVAEDATRDSWDAREYTWYRQDGKRHWLVGRQRIQPFSLLGDFDLAGMQFGWSNRPTGPTPQAFGSNVLFPRRGQATETVRGIAPPGTFVQLRVDGRVLEVEQVGYEGRFVFDRVRLPARRTSEIEILVFDPRNLSIPIEVRRRRLTASEFLLPDGVVSHTAGLGLAGRLDEGFAGSSRESLPRGLGGYYQWRQGFTRGVTAEASLQHNGRSAQGYLGLVTRLAPQWVATGGVIQTEGATGYNVNVDGYLPRWNLLVRSFDAPREFGLVEDDGGFVDHRIEAEFKVDSRLRVGAVARSRDDGTFDETFVLPTLTWRPVAEVFLDARPDLYGDYLLNGYWRARHDTRLRFFRSRSSSFEVSHDVGELYEIGWNTLFETVETRHTVYASRRGWTRRGSWYVRAGVVASEGDPGFMVSASGPLLPGVLARAEYQSLPLSTVGGRDEGRLTLNLVTDLSHAGGRLVPSSTQGFRSNTGTIVGRLLLDDASREALRGQRRKFELAGARIMIGGGGQATTDGGGRYSIGNLEPGVHELELDPGDLPLELAPLRARVHARVVPGAATRVDFMVRLEFGLAGRVVDTTGRALPGMRIVLVDALGIQHGDGWTDRFGLYRLDAVPPGYYEVQVLRNNRPIASREVHLVDDFVFGQDLTVDEALVAARHGAFASRQDASALDRRDGGSPDR